MAVVNIVELYLYKIPVVVIVAREKIVKGFNIAVV